MQINDVIHGFRIKNIRHLDEINADLYEMVHEKTNAKTIWLKRDDENKTFAIAFKTTPVDDTGVFHILEHSVLNGSRRYPVREPFVDLLKGSLQTFLNAMTYPDKTVYPVSSRNDKDFENLTRVYMDAVFYPLVLENPNVFYQEGWHYELDDINSEPTYKGVVFNEMKGAFSSADGVRTKEVMHSLFPDTCYGCESGGDPEHITDLTHEQFVAAHHKYYNPSNSYILLDGDMDIDKILGIINDEYLNDFDNSGEKISFVKQKPIINEKVVKEYEIAPNEDPKGKASISYAYVIGDYDDYEKICALSLISSVLCASNESPLKKAILDNKLGEDISFDVQDGIYQPFVEIDVINTDLEKENEIKDTIYNVLKDIVKNGIDKKELEATLNQREFKAKERDYGGMPKGLIFCLSSLDAWLYGGDPADGICVSKLYESLREKLNSDYYERLIDELIINSKHSSIIELKPSNTLGETKLENERNKLKNISAKWNNEDKEKILKLNNDLHVWQSSEDTPEQKATLPALHLDDLKKTPSKHEIEICKHGGLYTVIKHNQDSNGISYVSLLLKSNDFELQEYTVLSQLLSMLGKLNTENYDSLSLSRQMRSILGDFYASLSPMNNVHDYSNLDIVSLGFSCLHRNDKDAVDLIKEIIYRTDFSNTKAIRDILKQNIFALEQNFLNAGHALAVQRASAYSSPSAVVSEYSAGLEAYRYLKDLDDNWDTKANEFIDKLKDIYKRLFIKERYAVSVLSQDKPSIVRALIDDAPKGSVGPDTVKNPLGHRREGIIVPTNISFAAKNARFLTKDIDLGLMYVISNILTYDYLWNNIRVKNGAYGCGFRFGMAKSASFYSYRDPNPNNSLHTFKDTVNYLKDFVSKGVSIENYIVGTTGDFDPYLSLSAAIRSSNLEYLMGITYEDKQDILNKILSVDLNKIENIIPLFEEINNIDNVCVVGNKEALNNCEDLDDVFTLNKEN